MGMVLADEQRRGWVPMCQASANKDIDWKAIRATISSTIIDTVVTIANRILGSKPLVSCSNRRECSRWTWSSLGIGGP